SAIGIGGIFSSSRRMFGLCERLIGATQKPESQCHPRAAVDSGILPQGAGQRGGSFCTLCLGATSSVAQRVSKSPLAEAGAREKVKSFQHAPIPALQMWKMFFHQLLRLAIMSAQFQHHRKSEDDRELPFFFTQLAGEFIGAPESRFGFKVAEALAGAECR